jgi:hypothetical protein
MGTQNQTPDQSQQPGTRQPGGQSDDQQRDPQSKRTTKAKDAGNVPRSDDDVADEANQGTREDGTGSNVRGN